MFTLHKLLLFWCCVALKQVGKGKYPTPSFTPDYLVSSILQRLLPDRKTLVYNQPKQVETTFFILSNRHSQEDVPINVIWRC